MMRYPIDFPLVGHYFAAHEHVIDSTVRQLADLDAQQPANSIPGPRIFADKGVEGGCG